MRYEVQPGQMARFVFTEGEIAEATGRRLWAVHQQLLAIERRSARGQRTIALWNRLFAGQDWRLMGRLEFA